MKILVVAPLMIAALFTGAAQAQSMKVNFAGLDLDTPAGATELLTRLDVAAHSVCDAFDTGGGNRECRAKAIRAAVKQINKPQVTMVAENFKP